MHVKKPLRGVPLTNPVARTTAHLGPNPRKSIPGLTAQCEFCCLWDVGWQEVGGLVTANLRLHLWEQLPRVFAPKLQQMC